MHKAKNEAPEGGWQFRREVTLGTLVNLVVLLAIAVTGWSNLQKDLALIQHDLTSLIRTNAELTEHLEILYQRSGEQEYRLRAVERQIKLDEDSTG